MTKFITAYDKKTKTRHTFKVIGGVATSTVSSTSFKVKARKTKRKR